MSSAHVIYKALDCLRSCDLPQCVSFLAKVSNIASNAFTETSYRLVCTDKKKQTMGHLQLAAMSFWRHIFVIQPRVMRSMCHRLPRTHVNSEQRVCLRIFFYRKNLYRKNLFILYRAALLRWHHWNLKALSLVECRKNMVRLPHNDCYRTCTTPTSTQSGTHSSLTLKMKHHSVKACQTALKNNMTVWFTWLFVLNMVIQQH